MPYSKLIMFECLFRMFNSIKWNKWHENEQTNMPFLDPNHIEIDLSSQKDISNKTNLYRTIYFNIKKIKHEKIYELHRCWKSVKNYDWKSLFTDFKILCKKIV